MEDRLRTRIIIPLLVLLVLGVFYPVIFAPINSVDDPGMLSKILNLDSWSLRGIFFPGGSGTYYRPLLKISFLFDRYAWGLEESFMHLDNILLHLGNTLLLFATAVRAGKMLDVWSPLPPFLAAFFFAVHPINTESVDWISGRTDLLAGFFVLASAFFMLGRPRNTCSSLLAAFSFLLACLAKETAVFFLPAALLLPFFQPADEPNGSTMFEQMKRIIPHYLFFTSSGALYFTFRALAFTRADAGMKFVSKVAVGQGFDLLASMRLVLKAAGFYLKKLFVPFPLNFGIVHVSDLYIILGLILGIVVIFLLKRRSLIGYFYLTACSMGAAALMVPLLRMTWTPLAERYMYIPSAFFLIGLTFSVKKRLDSLQSRQLPTVVIALIAVVAVAGTAQRNFLWQDNLALFQDTARKSPDFVPAQNEIAGALYEQGRKDEGARIINSMVVTRELNNYQCGMISKAAVLADRGDVEGARKILRQVLEDPGRSEKEAIQRLLSLNGMGDFANMSVRLKFYDENCALLARFYKITKDPFCQYRLGQLHMNKGDRAKARVAFQRAVAQTDEKVYYHLPAKKLMEKMTY
jgi:predicted negative regulator of RcsB-dependent stress response